MTPTKTFTEAMHEAESALKAANKAIAVKDLPAAKLAFATVDENMAAAKAASDGVIRKKIAELDAKIYLYNSFKE
jgi:hypothetical protein